MTVSAAVLQNRSLEERARQSLGVSEDAIYRMVSSAVDTYGLAGGRLLDVGCGGAGLWSLLSDRFTEYCGLDAVRYERFPAGLEFRQVDLDDAQWPIDAASADVVAAVETIEHLENPWAFVRQLARIAKPGAAVLVTTPNQLSALSLLTLVTRRRFSAFQDVHYPAHRTALLESDLMRLVSAAGLTVIGLHFTNSGRVPLTRWRYPGLAALLAPRVFSDNVMIVARRPR
jgi:2-polyprenyl-3-methyl-5-hydroxy-6-metoxy-1,4-benzoquinol methylase